MSLATACLSIGKAGDLGPIEGTLHQWSNSRLKDLHGFQIYILIAGELIIGSVEVVAVLLDIGRQIDL